MLNLQISDGVVLEYAIVDDWQLDTPPCYQQEVTRFAETRRASFIAGRSVAHRALKRLGVKVQKVPIGSSGMPVWPASVVGSITHCGDRCAVAVARASTCISLGLDIEQRGYFSTEERQLVLTEKEQQALSTYPWPEDVTARLIFSAKESVYKCGFPLVRHYFDFLEAEIEWQPQQNTFCVHFLSTMQATDLSKFDMRGHFAFDQSHVFTFVTCHPVR